MSWCLCPLCQSMSRWVGCIHFQAHMRTFTHVHAYILVVLEKLCVAVLEDRAIFHWSSLSGCVEVFVTACAACMHVEARTHSTRATKRRDIQSLSLSHTCTYTCTRTRTLVCISRASTLKSCPKKFNQNKNFSRRLERTCDETCSAAGRG